MGIIDENQFAKDLVDPFFIRVLRPRTFWPDTYADNLRPNRSSFGRFGAGFAWPEMHQPGGPWGRDRRANPYPRG